MSSNSKSLKKEDVLVLPCANEVADDIFSHHYWLKRKRRSRRLSYSVSYQGLEAAWIQCADPFGTKLAKPLQIFDINDAIEICRGYFIDDTPSNIESCAIGKVLRLIPNHWYTSFGIVKKVAIIYQDIDAGQQGIVYRALGFVPYLRCPRARHHSKPTRGNSHGNKIVWARALRPVSGQHYKVCLPKYSLNLLNKYSSETQIDI